MNICILATATLVHRMGGTEVHCQTLSESASQVGHSMTIITTRHPQGLEYEKKDGCETYYLSNTDFSMSSYWAKLWWRESAKKIVQLHQEKPFDIIWAENLSGHYYAWKIKPVLRIPIISIIQGLGISGHLKSEWNQISSVGNLFSFAGKYLPQTVLFYLPWFWRTIKYSNALVSISKESAEAIKKEFSVDEKKIHIVFNGIDTDIFKPDEGKRRIIRSKYSLNEKDKLILMAGIVYKQKGMHVGLKAFLQIKKQIPNTKLMIVGDGPDLASLKHLAKQLRIEKEVIFCGRISNDEISSYYNAGDLFLNPTVRGEGLSIVTIEAMSCAKPVVISRIGGTQSTIDEGISGFFVEPKDVESLAKKSIEILSNPILAKKMGENAREKAVTMFSKEKMVTDYLNISQKLIARNV